MDFLHILLVITLQEDVEHVVPMSRGLEVDGFFGPEYPRHVGDLFYLLNQPSGKVHNQTPTFLRTSSCPLAIFSGGFPPLYGRPVRWISSVIPE